MTESRLTLETFPWDLGGQGKVHDDLTVLQDAGRSGSGDMVFLTVMAQRASDQKLIPLSEVDQAMTNAFLTCGAIDGTMAEFAAVTDAELRLTVDGEVITLADMDMSGLDSVLDTPGYMTCAALAVAMPIFAAVADAQFSITVDGVAINITADFSGINAEDDTAGFYTGGTNGAVIGSGWDAITDGTARFVVNGVTIDLTALDFSNAVTFDDVADTFNYALNGQAVMLYDWKLNIFKLVSNITGETSILGTPANEGTGTDMTASGYLNMAAAGAATAGTGGEGTNQTVEGIINAEAAGRFTCFYDGDQYIFISRTAGEVSSVSVLSAGAGGTDVSGAGFLNGAAGAATPGTGGEGLGESIASIINAHAAGRFTVDFNGDAFVLFSPTQGPVKSQITVMVDPSAGGTFIGGAGFMNGITAVGTVTAATGANGTDKPAGVLMSRDITEALIIAGDVDDQVLLIGSDKMIDEDLLVFEGGVTLASVVVSTGLTVRASLELLGIYPRKSQNDQQIAPI